MQQLIEHTLDAAAVAAAHVIVSPDPHPGDLARACVALVGVDRCSALSGGRAMAAPAVIVVGGPGEEAAMWHWAQQLGAQGVIQLPDAGPWLSERLLDLAEPVTGDTRALVLISAAGGAGASTLATAVAVRAAQSGQDPILVDADPGAGALEVTLGEPDLVPEPGWQRFAAVSGRLPREELAGLPRASGVRLLGWQPHDGSALLSPQWRNALAAVVAAARREAALTIVDLGRPYVDALAGLTQAHTDVIIVVPARLRSVIAASRMRDAIGQYWTGTPRLVVRDVGGAMSPQQIGTILAADVVAELGSDPRCRDDEERGRPAGTRRRSAVGRCADRLLALQPHSEAA